jgi:hypothetical protein
MKTAALTRASVRVAGAKVETGMARPSMSLTEYERHCHGASGLRFSRQARVAKRVTKISYAGYRSRPRSFAKQLALLPVHLSLRDVEDLLAERGGQRLTKPLGVG